MLFSEIKIIRKKVEHLNKNGCYRGMAAAGMG